MLPSGTHNIDSLSPWKRVVHYAAQSISVPVTVSLQGANIFVARTRSVPLRGAIGAAVYHKLLPSEGYRASTGQKT